MEVDVTIAVKQGDAATAGGSTVAVQVFGKTMSDSAKAVDTATGGLITRALGTGDFKGSAGSVDVLYPESSGAKAIKRVILVGCGDKKKFDAETARTAAGALTACLRSLKVSDATLGVDTVASAPRNTEIGQGLAEGALLGVYRYDNYFRDGRAEPLKLTKLTLMATRAGAIAALKAGAARGTHVGLAVNQARELVNGPPNDVTPTYLAKTATQLGKAHGFKVTVLGEAECRKEKMGAFLAVAQGAHEPCKFIVMDYSPAKAQNTICLVGKGITFDTGGISLKPGQDMDQMKYDMGGAAAVIAALKYAATAKVPMRVVGIVAATENMPDGKAYRPGDILTSSAGVTIEVLNTDAEGRLVLCDALHYAKRFNPDAVVDLATLTGACVIALGGHAAGLMGNDEWLLDQVWSASMECGERAWPLPMWSEYRDMVKSNVADIKNTGGRSAGAITAGAFLGAFTNDYRWAHLDIAGIAWGESAKTYQSQGGTGGGVRILAEFLNRWKKPPRKGPAPGKRTSLRVTAADKA